MMRTSVRCDGDITVITASLDDQPDFIGLLSPDERARAGRFRFPTDRRRYIAGRGILRRLLAERIDVPAGDIELVAGRHGKPSVASHPDVVFNVSHSRDVGMFAFAPSGELGVDVEHVRDLDPLTLAQSYFSEMEQKELRSLHPADQLYAFFDGWVRKEAVIKADGRGMSLPLDSFSITLVGDPYVTEAPPPGDAHWDLRSLPVATGACAALAWKTPSPVFIS